MKYHDEFDDPLMEADRYLRLSELARYSTLSENTLRRAIADKHYPLRCYHYGRIVLVRKREFDEWLKTRQTPAAQLRAAHPELTGERLRMALALRGYPVPSWREPFPSDEELWAIYTRAHEDGAR